MTSHHAWDRASQKRKHLALWGYSDDSAYITVSTDRETYHESDDCFERVAYAEIANDDGGILASFCYVGTWIIGIGQLDEGIPIPEWAEHPTTQMMDDDAYTVALEMDVPEDVRIRWRRYDQQRNQWIEEGGE